MTNTEIIKEFNVLVVDDDPFVLSSYQSMYTDLIESGAFSKILGESSGSVSLAGNTKEAEVILIANFKKNTDLIQIMHVDQRMPEETGSDFVNRMRWKYAGRKIGALLVTAYPTDNGVINSRESGVYKYISKPVSLSQIFVYLENLIEVIFSREKPKKRTLDRPFIFKKINSLNEFIEYSRLRYSVFDFMNYLQQHNDQRLDLDRFDPYSIPFGVFEQEVGRENIQATIRIITPSYQRPYGEMIARILAELKPKIVEDGIPTLDNFIRQERKGPFLVAESVDLSRIINKLEQDGQKYGEFSRIIDHPDFRGFGLSRLAIESALAYSRINGIRAIFGGCHLQHHKMYAKYGWRVIPDTNEFLEKKVQQVSYVMVMDIFEEIDPEVGFRIHSFWEPQYRQNGFTCISPENNPFI